MPRIRPAARSLRSGHIGTSDDGLRSHCRRWSSVLSRVAPANEVREAKWVRLGANWEVAEVPEMAWHDVHWVWKVSQPAAAAPSVGNAAGSVWARAHAANSASVWANTRWRMSAWARPQNSAHCPM